MSTARVTSISALREFRLALAKYRSEAAAALIEAESNIQRTLVWLRHDRLSYWQKELRKRQELLARAKSDMYRHIVASDSPRASVDQKKGLDKAKRQLDEAEAKLTSIKRAIRILDHELVLYRGEVQGLSGMIESDLVMAESRLERMADDLDAYAQLLAPEPDSKETVRDQDQPATSETTHPGVPSSSGPAGAPSSSSTGGSPS
ncbi:MAG: hypothetical protein H7210_01080 [Pyrinomonadaceae bacterium]|nr:hypothetical protein [Phycisphaerales bacterium]